MPAPKGPDRAASRPAVGTQHSDRQSPSCCDDLLERIAVLSDVHGNLLTLEAVLTDVTAQK